MSYCRTSEPGCDVYCYKSLDSYEVHIAYGRIKPAWMPHPRKWIPKRFKSQAMRRREILRFLNEPLIPTGLPLDGESYYFQTPRECAEALITLQEIGYGVPEDAIERLLDEADAERDQNATA